MHAFQYGDNDEDRVVESADSRIVRGRLRRLWRFLVDRPLT